MLAGFSSEVHQFIPNGVSRPLYVEVLKVDNPYNKVTGCLSVCLFVLKDLANR